MAQTAVDVLPAASRVARAAIANDAMGGGAKSPSRPLGLIENTRDTHCGPRHSALGGSDAASGQFLGDGAEGKMPEALSSSMIGNMFVARS